MFTFIPTSSEARPVSGGKTSSSLSLPLKALTASITAALLTTSAQAASRNIFNSDFIIESGGSIITNPFGGDLFRIGGSFLVTEPNFSLWDTRFAVLEFSKGTKNTTGNHTLLYAGLDLGPTYTPLFKKSSEGAEAAGYTPNLAWGEVVIAPGNSLSTGGGALYTDRLTLSGSLGDITAQIATFTGSMKIYYDPVKNPFLGGQTFAFAPGNEGFVAPVSESNVVSGNTAGTLVPEPSATMFVVVGATLLGWRRRRRTA